MTTYRSLPAPPPPTDDGPPTKRSSKSFSSFMIRAESLAETLTEAHLLWGGRHPQMADMPRAKRAYAMAQRLRKMSAQFGMWPRMSAETVAFERAHLPDELTALENEASRLLAPREESKR